VPSGQKNDTWLRHAVQAALCLNSRASASKADLCDPSGSGCALPCPGEFGRWVAVMKLTLADVETYAGDVAKAFRPATPFTSHRTGIPAVANASGKSGEAFISCQKKKVAEQLFQTARERRRQEKGSAYSDARKESPANAGLSQVVYHVATLCLAHKNSRI
jgi:hypothetical protein